MKLSDLHKHLLNQGISYSMDNLRKLEKNGLIICSYSPEGHRVFNQEQFNLSVRYACKWFFGLSKEEILKNEGKDKIKKILKKARELIKENL